MGDAPLPAVSAFLVAERVALTDQGAVLYGVWQEWGLPAFPHQVRAGDLALFLELRGIPRRTTIRALVLDQDGGSGVLEKWTVGAVDPTPPSMYWPMAIDVPAFRIKGPSTFRFVILADDRELAYHDFVFRHGEPTVPPEM